MPPPVVTTTCSTTAVHTMRVRLSYPEDQAAADAVNASVPTPAPTPAPRLAAEAAEAADAAAAAAAGVSYRFRVTPASETAAAAAALSCQSDGLSVYTRPTTLSAAEMLALALPAGNESTAVERAAVGAALNYSVLFLSCRAGNRDSEVTVTALQVGSCCAGTDSHSQSGCEGQLLFEDDFSSCDPAAGPDPAKWTAVRGQWGGAGTNGGVHPANVDCHYDAESSGNVLRLQAHGDYFSDLSHAAVGVDSQGSDRGPAAPFTGWQWGGYTPAACDAAAGGPEACHLRRVGAQVGVGVGSRAPSHCSPPLIAPPPLIAAPHCRLMSPVNH
jgi:hypothetical protein